METNTRQELKNILIKAGLPSVAAYGVATGIDMKNPDLIRIAISRHIDRLCVERDAKAAEALRRDEQTLDELQQLSEQIGAATMDPLRRGVEQPVQIDREDLIPILNRIRATEQRSEPLSDKEKAKINAEVERAMGL